MHTCYANIELVAGTGKGERFHVPNVELFQTQQAMDNDVDGFSVDVGDVQGDLLGMVDRDTEVHVDLFADDQDGVKQVFAGLVDVETLVSDKTHTLVGSDIPSGVLVATDAAPGYWRHIDPRHLILQRCRTLGLTDVRVSSMARVGRLWSNASEKEWAFQYRVARMGGCFMWSTDTGRLIIAPLNYSSSSYAYAFGHAPKGQQDANWIPVQDVSLVSNKQQRVEKVIVYGEDKKKKGEIPTAISVNPPSASMRGWLRRPTAYSTLSTGNTQKALKTEADLQIFESLVGAQEYTLTVGGELFVQQNQMARVNLPEYGLVGHFYVVGVNRGLSPSGGLTQDVRLREKGYALDTRVPTAPKLSTQPNLATGQATASLAEALSQQGGIRWSAAFIRATREFLVPLGWDFSSVLGVLLAICSQETGFKNDREIANGTGGVEWHRMPTRADIGSDFFGDHIVGETLRQLQEEWRKNFANSKGDPDNPFSARGAAGGEAGVGPMQLTSLSLKQQADRYGWGGGSTPSGTPEFAGGRWYPESNIRVAAHFLAECIKGVGANPTNFGTIWKAVAAYNVGVTAAIAGGGTAYADKVRAAYQSTYGPAASAAASNVQKTGGTPAYTFTDGKGHVIVSLPKNTPKTVARAVTYAMNLRGQSLYLWGGYGQVDASGTPRYDCSSFVAACLVHGDPKLKGTIVPPNRATRTHGDTTYSLWGKGKKVSRDQLLPGDLVFFDGIENGHSVPVGHVGMYLGDGEFIADPSTGEYVTIDSLNAPYYRERYNGARRFFSWPKGAG